MLPKDELLKKVLGLNNNKKFQEVIDLLDNKTLKKFNSPELYAEKARAYYGINELDECFKLAEQSIDINPTSVAYNYRGNVWYKKKDYDKAIDDYNKAIQLDPSYRISYGNRGNAWYQKKEYDKAIEDFTKAIDLKPNSASLYFNRGIAWNNKNEPDKAIEDFNKTISFDPNKAEAYENRGLSWSTKKEYDKAIEDYNRAIELSPDDAGTYNRRGIAFGMKKKYDKALDDFNKVIQLSPNHFNAHNNLGVVWFNKKDYNKAIEKYNDSILIKPNNALAYRNLGDVYKELGELDKAIDNYKKAIKIDASFAWLQSSIDELKAKNKKIDEIKIEGSKPAETTLYFLVKTIDSLNISTTDKKLLKDVGNIFLQTVNNIIDYSFANNEDPVVHYTKLKVADLVINQAKEPFLRYYNVVYMNDPEEGATIFDCLNDEEIKECFKSGMGAQDNNIYLGSFLPAKENDKKNNHEDELVMWRTYGKDENRNEAAGCSIVIMPDFFSKDKNYLHSEMHEKGTNEDERLKSVSNQALYSVLYFDKRDGNIIDSKNKNLSSLINDLRSAIKTFIALKKTSAMSEEKNKAIDKIIYRFLTEIRYLFKSADYAFESELRVIQYASPQPNENENLVKIDDNGGLWLPRRLYIESNKGIRPYINKIYLGPKVPNPQTWMYLETVMKLKGYNKMELKKSSCKFQ